MKKLMKTLAVFTVAMSTLTGCGSSNSDEKPKQEITVGNPGQVTTLDPAVTNDTYTIRVEANVYRTLFKLNDKGELVNDLCKDYTVSEDGLTYTFNIIDNALWSDGKPITAHDFEYAVKRAISFGGENAYNATSARTYIVNAKEAFEADKSVKDMDDVGIKALSDTSFEVKLNSPVAYFPKLWTFQMYTPLRADVATEKSSDWANSADVPVSGPFKYKEISPNEKVVLVKNNKYYKADEVKLKKITFQVMTDSTAQLNAFKSGEIDFALQVPNEAVKSYGDKDDLYMVDPYVSNYFIAINSQSKENPAMGNALVRKALAMAIDKEQLKKVLDSGDYVTALNGLVPKGITGVDGDFRSEADKEGNYIKYDMDAAKKLLEEAGYTKDNPLKFDYKFTNSQIHKDIAQYLQSQWKKLGAEVTLTSVEQGVYYAQLDQGQYDMGRYGLSATVLDPNTYLEMWVAKNQVTEQLSDPKYDEMIENANKEPDPTKRLEMLHDAEDYLINDQAYLIPLITNSNVMLKKQNIKGVENTPPAVFYFDKVSVE